MSLERDSYLSEQPAGILRKADPIQYNKDTNKTCPTNPTQWHEVTDGHVTQPDQYAKGTETREDNNLARELH